jgi:hypothetical protein
MGARKLASRESHHRNMRYNRGRSPSPEGSRTTREIDLATAISEIKQAREQTEDGKSPFFIIAGAGISASFVPLASGILQERKAGGRKSPRISPRGAADNSPGRKPWVKRNKIQAPHRGRLSTISRQ